jgi:hypothetical protein
MKLFYLILLLNSILTSCTHSVPSVTDRKILADKISQAAGWNKQTITTDKFILTAYNSKIQSGNKVLTIYIEGDGYAWINSSLASSNPTPINPLALKLALKHGKGNIAYLARPCQFINEDSFQECDKKYWTDARFSSEIIAANHQAINQLKEQFGASKLQLVGYSGGGAVATIIAAQRSDIVNLITVAGNLDHKAWTKARRISPLENSLNPADFWETLQNIPQVHFVGRDDRNITINVAESFISNFPEDKKPTIKIIDTFTHSCCWIDEWPMLLESTTFTE